MRSILASWLAVGSVAALTACAPSGSDDSRAPGRPARSTSAPHPLSGAYYVGAITKPIDYDQGSILLAPPGRKTAALTWQQAVAHCRGQGCITGAKPEVSLALATTLRSGKVRHDGSVIPGSDHALAYVLTARNHACGLPGGSVPSRPELVERGDCTVVQLIDATTGRIGYAMTGHFIVTDH